ncbi:MAG TPA: hypothetical protein VGH76_12485 [Actinomycetospora sp.]
MITQVDQRGEEPVEPAQFRVAADQGAVRGVGEQPPPPPLALRAGQEVAHDPAGQRPVPDQLPGGLVVGVEQGVEGQHDPHLDVHVGGCGLSGDTFDEGVGDELVAGAAVGVPGGDQRVGVFPQRGQARHPLLDRQQPGEHGHGVRRRTQRHPTILAGGAAAGGEPGPVGLVGLLLHRGLGLAQSLVLEAGLGELLVDQSALLGLEVTRQRHDRLREPLGNPPRRQQRPRGREIDVQGAGHPQPAGAGDRGDVAGQPDLVGHTATQRARVQPTCGDLSGLDLDLGAGERDHGGVLRRRERGPHAFQDGDPIDQGGAAVGGGIGCGVGEFGEAREQRGQLGADRVTRPARIARTYVRETSGTL